MATLNPDPRASVEVTAVNDLRQTQFPLVALNQADAGDSQAGQSRWEGPVEIASLSTARPRAWHNELSSVPQNFYRQILGLNPFRTSYFALYRPLNDWQSRLIIITGFILAIAAGVPLPIIGVLFGKIINNFPPSEDELKTRLGQLLGTASLYFVFTWGWAVCWGTTGERLSRKMREDLVERILGMDPSYFDLQTPDITQILTEKSQTIQLGTSEKVGLFLQSVSYFVAAFTVGFILDARLTGILLVAVIPAMGLIVYLGSKLISKYAKRASHCSREASTIAESAIKAVQVVQAFGVANILCKSHGNQRNAAFAHGLRKALSGALMLGCIYFVAYSANALAFWEGHRQFNDQSGDSGQAGTVYAVVFLILDASFVVGQFGPFIQTFALAASAGGSIFDILNHPSPHIDVYSKEGQQTDADTFSHDITFKDVTFVYPARPMLRILECLNLVIRPGITTGLVGASGSGKSTIASLLLRLYDPSSGSIMIGPKDIRQFNLKDWRSHIALVDQHSFLFSGTILDNISDGLGYDHDLSQEDVLKLCTKAAADANCDFIASLPDGLYTVVGASGTQLSGGQKQRICLARALVADPRILILDEYTSAMDATSESLVVDALKRTSAQSGRTTIIIAHRLATVKDADQIVVFGEGAVVESGDHKDLIELGGAYKALVEAQKFDKTSSSAESSIRRAKSDFNSTTKSAMDSAATSPGPQTVNKSHAEKTSSIRVLQQCFMLSQPDLPLILLGILASVISGAIVMGEAIVFGNLVRILNGTSSRDESNREANFFCLMFFILALIALFSYTVSGIAFGIVSERFIRRVQDISLRTILAQDIAWFSEKDNSAHALISRLNRDVGNLSGLSNVILGTIVSVLTSVVGGIILAHYVAWKIAIVLLAAVPVMLLAGFFRLHVLSKAEERHQTAYIGASALASEACANIRTVAILGRESHTLKLYKQSLKITCDKGLQFTIFANVLLAFSLSITYFVYALAYWWGSKQVREGAYSILDFFIVLPALLFSAQAAGQMFSLAPEITKAKFAARSIFELHDEKPTINKISVSNYTEQSSSSPATSIYDDEKPTNAGKQQLGSIELRNVSLIYPTRQNTIALDDISLSISPGQFVAFVGRSGAGKTSLISLLERFIDPTTGSVCVGSSNIREVDVETHRERISLVEQEPDLFPGSIIFNVSLGARHGQEVTPQQIEDICKKVGLHEFIMSLPEGYNTECGSNGSRLSGGQRQRIALARALLRDPEILLLDEATSQLDANTEQAIQHAVAAAASGRTTIMVAHRLSSIQHADNIFVFDHGRLVEQGTHDELVVLGGIYASMVAAQELT